MKALPSVLLAFALCPGFASAERVALHRDADSLMALCTVAVRAEIVDAGNPPIIDGKVDAHAMKVLEVFKGSANVGDALNVSGLAGYYHAFGMAGAADSWDAIHKGDVVYLFITSDKRHGVPADPKSADLTIVDSGVRLVSGPNVYDFGQTFNFDQRPRGCPHGFVAKTRVSFPGSPVETQQAFEKRLRDFDQLNARVDRLVSAEFTPETKKQIIDLLRARSSSGKNFEDADELSSRLALCFSERASPSEVAAIYAESGWHVRRILGSGMQRPAGRAYLLARLGDQAASAEQRLEAATILSDAGWTYVREVRDAKPNEPHAFDFATSLARLAAANVGTPLGERLLRGVADCATGGPPSDGPLAADLDAAAKILCDAFPKAGPVDQFRIAETVMQISGKRYKQMLPNAGDLLTLTEPDRDFAAALSKRKLHLSTRFRSQLTYPTDLKLVLRPTNGKPEIELKANTEIGEMTNSFGYHWLHSVDLPAGVAGEYRVFLRDYAGERQNGDGLGFKIQIPSP